MKLIEALLKRVCRLYGRLFVIGCIAKFQSAALRCSASGSFGPNGSRMVGDAAGG